MAEIKTIKRTYRNGSQVGDWQFKYSGKDIRNWQFYYESKADNGFDVVKKSIGNGMYILNNDTLIIDGHIENRKPGNHTAYLKVVNEDGPDTFFCWKLTIQPKVVSAPEL